MPLPTESRIRLEWGLRAAALGLLGVLAWRLDAPVVAPVLEAGARSLPSALAAATRSEPAALQLQLDSLPDATAREWLRALERAGTPVRYAAQANGAPVMSVEPLARPGGEVRVTAFAAGATLRLSDDVGPLDDSVSSGSVRTLDAALSGGSQAETPRGVAKVAEVIASQQKAVLVLGRAGWEGKFVALALQEAGWRVESELRVNSATAGTAATVRSPGAQTRIDTARYAAVVLLDETTATRAASIQAFLAEGGGVVIAPDALSLASMARIAPAAAGAAQTGALGGVQSSSPLLGLDREPLVSLRRDAVVLQRLGAEVLAAARREGVGRVVQLAVRDTWRWRMEGADGALEAHAAWWSQMVGAAAMPPAIGPALPADDPAPYPALVEAIGAPMTSLPTIPAAPTSRNLILLAAICALLLVEVASRRLRGVS